MGRSKVRAVLALGTVAMVFAVGGSAGAYPVSGEQLAIAGKQTVVNEGAGTYKVSGGLLGNWKITSFKELASKPVFKGKGTESFDGCIDVKLDGSCKGDPLGTMKFRFRYWGRFDAKDALQLGACAHPVTGGSGDFTGATGFLMMVDTPIGKPPFVTTEYEGVITLGRPLVARRPPPRC